MAKKVLGYVELEWVCPSCQTKNKGSQRTCITCGAPQPEEAAFEQVEGAELIEDEAVATAAASGADIHCAFCGARNPATATKCSQCGADLTQGKARQAGKVLGAYQTEPAAEIPCPHCGSLNPANAERCTQCGGNLPHLNAAPSETAPTQISKFSIDPMKVALILAVVLVCGLFIWWTVASNRTETTTATLQDVQWQRAVIIEALAPVQHEAWKDEIPSEAAIGACTSQQRYVSDKPQPQSTEVCGTPYTIDTGTGKGEVVQDCHYLVYDLSCQYTQPEWKKENEAVLKGKDYNPIWPQPILQRDHQRLGEKRETYVLFFNVDGKIYPYETSDYSLFEQSRSIRRWLLHINSFDKVVSVEAAK